MLKEGADGVEPSVTRARAVVALLLEVVEEGEYDVTVEFLKGKSTWRFACTFRGK
jgi:hypothetical protein